MRIVSTAWSSYLKPWVALIVCWTAASFAFATERHALLIGVGNYPYLAGNLQLLGPANDMAMVNDVLREKGFAAANITELSDRSGTLPTRDAIYAAFDSLERKIRAAGGKEQMVYLHFAGHGSQQPAKRDSDELDRLDEIFLPRDAKGWRGPIGRVENSITDDEIGELITGLRTAGAFVWVVFDACHSGTMTRSMNNDVVMRKVDPCQLGIPGCNNFDAVAPEDETAEIELRAPTTRGFGSSQMGGLVAFYAAQSTETTPEMRLPRGGMGKKMGFFTYQLMQGLLSGEQLTYRQLAERVVHGYSRFPWFQSRPLVEGTDLDRYVFEQREQRTPQWPLRTKGVAFSVPAGQVHGLTQGTVVGIYPGPNAQVGEELGYARVTSAEVGSAVVEPIPYNGMKAFARPPQGAYVQIVERYQDLKMRVAVHRESDDRAPLNTMLRKTAGSSPLLEQVTGIDDADLIVSANSRRLWFLDPGQELPCQLQTALTTSQQQAACRAKQAGVQLTYLDLGSRQMEEALASGLDRIAKVRSLINLAGDIGEGSSKLETIIEVDRRRGRDLRLTGDSIPTVRDGDSMRLKVRNKHTGPMDVSVFFVGSDYSVTQIFPDMGLSNRIEGKGELREDLGSVSVETTGREHMVVVASRVERNAAPSDYAFLQQGGLDSVAANEVKRRMLGNSLFDLWQSTTSTGTRAFKPKKGGATDSIRVFSWRVAAGE